MARTLDEEIELAGLRIKKEFQAFGEFAEATGQAAISAVPGAQIAQLPEDATGVQKASTIAGEIAGGAGLVAGAVATGGVAPLLKAIGVGSAITGVLESRGFSPALRETAKIVEREFDEVTGLNLPSKVAGIEGLGDILNFVSRSPGANASTLIEFIPAGIAAAVGGKVAPVKKAIEKPRPVPVAQEAQAAIVEASEALGKPVKRPITGREAAAEVTLKPLLRDLRKVPDKAIGSIVETASKVAKPNKVFGEFAARKVENRLRIEKQVSFDEKGKIQASQSADAPVARKIDSFLKRLRGAKSPRDIQNIRTSFDKEVKRVFGQETAGSKIVTDARKAMNDAIDAVVSKANPTLGNNLKRFRTESAKVRSVEEAFDKSVSPSTGEFDPKRFRAIIQSKELGGVIKKRIGKENFSKLEDLVKTDAGLASRAKGPFKLLRNLFVATRRVGAAQGSAIETIAVKNLTEPQFQLPKSKLKFLDAMEEGQIRSTKISSLLKSLDSVLAASVAQKETQRSK